MDPSVPCEEVCEKYLANGNDVFWAFMDLEKAYDTIDRHGPWQMQECTEFEKNSRKSAIFSCR